METEALQRLMMNKTMKMLCAILPLLIFAAGSLQAADSEAGWTNVQKYFPADWKESGVDLKGYIQKALDENVMVRFPGNHDAENPLVYRSSSGIIVPAGRKVRFEPEHRVLRLPSKGALFKLQDGVHFAGAIVDGNKYAHWPEFQDLGKGEYGILMDSHCLVEDCVVFNNPGTAFGTWKDYNKIYRCVAENVGYIDVKFGVMFYQGNRDQYSGDGFYIRGTGNLIQACAAYDTFRWDFCSSHKGARQNTYVDCRGGDVNIRSYGFIDIEGADDNNRLIRCLSPNTHIAIPGSAGTEVIQCTASYISAYDHQNPDTVKMYGGKLRAPLLDGNITTQGGIVLGGWASSRDRLIPGAIAPIVVNNRMYKNHSGPTALSYSDWSFSVHSVDGNGVVSNNLLFEFDDGFTKGPGMKLENMEGSNNQVIYGQWSLDLPQPYLRYGHFQKASQRTARVAVLAADTLRAYTEAEGGKLRSDLAHWLPLKAWFIKEKETDGEKPGPEKLPGKPSDLTVLPLTEHWDFHIGTFYGPAWYYLYFKRPEAMEDRHLALFFSGIDSEAKIFLNGKEIGIHSGWNRPSHVSLPPGLLHPPGEENLLALRVWSSPTGMAGIYGPIALVPGSN